MKGYNTTRVPESPSTNNHEGGQGGTCVLAWYACIHRQEESIRTRRRQEDNLGGGDGGGGDGGADVDDHAEEAADAIHLSIVR